MRVNSFRDLMAGNEMAEIICIIKRRVVRRLRVEGDNVRIAPLDGPELIIPLNTPITFEPWFMDRGNLLFSCQEIPEAKICTELDLVRFPDGREETVEA